MSKQYDHYHEARNLITMLRDTQLNDQADSLQSAMDDGSTGSEIFMALRRSIENLISEKICTDIAQAKAKKLWEELDRALQ